MLAPTDLAHLARRVTYRPGWSITVHPHHERWPYDGPMLRIVAEVPNAYRPDETTDLGIWTAVPPMPDSTAFYDWLLWRLIRVEVHEAREFYRVNGAVWSDPHQDG